VSGAGAHELDGALAADRAGVAGVMPTDWSSGEDAAMREYREEGVRRLAKQPKGAQPGPSLPPRVSRDERERDRDDG